MGLLSGRSLHWPPFLNPPQPGFSPNSIYTFPPQASTSRTSHWTLGRVRRKRKYWFTLWGLMPRRRARSACASPACRRRSSAKAARARWSATTGTRRGRPEEGEEKECGTTEGVFDMRTGGDKGPPETPKKQSKCNMTDARSQALEKARGPQGGSWARFSTLVGGARLKGGRDPHPQSVDWPRLQNFV